jgi:uncharacterized protein YecE (DUF72 family)
LSKLYIGCSGWSYDGWLGHFYPSNLDRKDFLKYYSQVFDFVEIDSSFYRPPNLFMTKRWDRITPDNFKFTAKFPRSITHEKRLAAESEKELRYFLDMMRPLQRKLLALLIQLPPTLSANEGLKKLEALFDLLDPHFRYAIEVRHTSWFDSKKFYKLLFDSNICLAWSQLDTIQTPPELTSDFLYLRFIGDRSIDEKDFGTLQKDRFEELQRWSKEVIKLRDKARFAIVAANNHYAGFGPATANSFRKMIGLKEVVWEEMKQDRL